MKRFILKSIDVVVIAIAIPFGVALLGCMGIVIALAWASRRIDGELANE